MHRFGAKNVLNDNGAVILAPSSARVGASRPGSQGGPRTPGSSRPGTRGLQSESLPAVGGDQGSSLRNPQLSARGESGSVNLPDVKKKERRASPQPTRGAWGEAGAGGAGAKVKASQLLQMADLLWKLGEEQKRQGDDTLPDERIKSFCDELLDIVDTCAGEGKRNATLRKDVNSLEDTHRIRRELQDANSKVSSHENMFVVYMNEREKGKRRNLFCKDFAVKARLELHDTTNAALAFGAWQTAIAKQRYEQEAAAITLKLRADGFAAKAETMMRGLGHKGAAAMAQCFSGWSRLMRASIMRKRALGALTRQLAVHDDAIVTHFTGFWFTLAKWQKEERLHKVTKETSEENMEAITAEKKRMAERFGLNAMANMQRKINGNSSQILADMLSYWVLFNKESRSERTLQEQQERAAMELKRAALEARAGAVSLALNGSATKLRKDAFAMWQQAAKDEINMRRLKDKAMNSTLRSISGSEIALKDAVASAWLKDAMDGRMRRALEVANTRYMELKVQTRKDKFKACAMGMGRQDRELKAKIFVDWGTAIDLRKKKDATKEERFAKAARMIANSNESLMQFIWQTLGKTVLSRQNKAKNMEKAIRILGGLEMKLKEEIFGIWFKDITENKNLRVLQMQAEQAQKMLEMTQTKAREAAEKARQQKMKVIDKTFGDNLMVLGSLCLNMWREETAAQKLRKKRSGQSMATVLRAIDKASSALSAEVFAGWAKLTKEQDLLARLGSAEQQAAIIKNARERAVAMFEKTVNGNWQQIKVLCFFGWIDEKAAERKRELRREIITARVMRNVSGGEEVVKAMLMATWLQLTETNRDLGIERRRLKRMNEIGREVIQRLRCRNLIKLSFIWWYMRAC